MIATRIVLNFSFVHEQYVPIINLVEGFGEYKKNMKGASLDSVELLTNIIIIKDED